MGVSSRVSHLASGSYSDTMSVRMACTTVGNPAMVRGGGSRSGRRGTMCMRVIVSTSMVFVSVAVAVVSSM